MCGAAAPCQPPLQPCIVEQVKVVLVVGHQDSAAVGSGQQYSAVIGTIEAEATHGRRSVAGRLKQAGDVVGCIVVEQRTRHISRPTR